MNNDKLARQGRREYLQVVEGFFCNEYPNPQRVGCLGEPERTHFLHALAFHHLEAPAISTERLSHLAHCSPCSRELFQLRGKARNIM